MSGDQRVNEKMAASRDIDFYYSRNKILALPRLTKTYGVSIEDVCYVGDDTHDDGIMSIIQKGGGPCFCPKDAWEFLKEKYQVLDVDGGHGVVMALYERIYKCM